MLLKRIVCWFIGHHLEFDRLESGIPIRRCRHCEKIIPWPPLAKSAGAMTQDHGPATPGGKPNKPALGWHHHVEKFVDEPWSSPDILG